MAEISRLSESNDWIELDFVERERTPELGMKLGIQLHLAGLSISSTISAFAELGVQRSREAVHNWVQKADLQPISDKNPNQIVVDETVIRINDQRYWLYAAADPDTNGLLHFRLFSTTTTTLTEIFLREPHQNHDVEDAVFLVDDATHLQTALHRAGLRFQTERHGNRNAVKRIFREETVEPLRSQTVSVTLKQTLLKIGSKTSLAGIMLQTKHYRINTVGATISIIC